MVICKTFIPLVLCCARKDECLETGRKTILEWNPMPPDDSCTITSQGEYIVKERFEIRVDNLTPFLVSHQIFLQGTDDCLAVHCCRVEMSSGINESLKREQIVLRMIFMCFCQNVKRSSTEIVDSVHISTKLNH